MKKILLTIAAVAALLSISSCNKSFPHEGTATEALAGNWFCSIYVPGESGWEPYYEAEYMTYNTAANKPTEMWIDDAKGFWGTKAKIDADVAGLSFGKEGVEYQDLYFDVPQKIFGGKITVGGAKAPESGTICDKIEFFIQFSDDQPSYGTTYYVVGYRRTGFPEEDEVCIWDWENLPAVR